MDSVWLSIENLPPRKKSLDFIDLSYSLHFKQKKNRENNFVKKSCIINSRQSILKIREMKRENVRVFYIDRKVPVLQCMI